MARVKGSRSNCRRPASPCAPVTNVQVVTVRFEPAAPGVVSRVLRIRTDLEGGTAAIPVEAEGVKP